MNVFALAEKSVEKSTACAGPGPHRSIRRARDEGHEVALIDRLRAGDEAARTAVVRRYHSALVQQASRILHDGGRAEDVVQDAWLAAFACIDRFELRSSLFAWLVRIVINRAMAIRRREVRSLPFSACATWPSGTEGDEGPEFPGLGPDEASPERLLLEREALRRFNTAVQALPETQRSVLLLRDFAGASAGETCKALRINDLAHRVRLCRARASIRQALQSACMPAP